MQAKKGGKTGRFKVGYGKPPEKTRFRKGRSGNPSGRAKGSRNLTTVLLEALGEPVYVNENGRRKQMTKGETAITQMVNKAAAGDQRALKMLLDELVRRGTDDSEDQHREETKQQLLMLERLTVDERLQLRRLVAKAQGIPETVDV